MSFTTAGRSQVWPLFLSTVSHLELLDIRSDDDYSLPLLEVRNNGSTPIIFSPHLATRATQHGLEDCRFSPPTFSLLHIPPPQIMHKLSLKDAAAAATAPVYGRSKRGGPSQQSGPQQLQQQQGPPQLPPQMFTTAAQLLDLTDSTFYLYIICRSPFLIVFYGPNAKREPLFLGSVH